MKHRRFGTTTQRRWDIAGSSPLNNKARKASFLGQPPRLSTKDYLPELIVLQKVLDIKLIQI